MKLILATSKFCGPCHLLKRMLENEKISVETVAMEDDMDVFKQYGIKAVPRLLVVENNKLVESIQGVDDIVRTIKKYDQDKKEQE